MYLTAILLTIGATILIMALRSLRAQRLKERYAILFVLVGLPFIVLAAWPDAVGFLAAKLQIEYPTVLLLGVTTFFLLMNFKLLSLLSLQERRIATLAQLVSLLPHDRDQSNWKDALLREAASGRAGTSPEERAADRPGP